VVISEKSKPELRKSDFSGIAVSRMSTMRIELLQPFSVLILRSGPQDARLRQAPQDEV
jgi:hypothetical protein